MQLFEERNDEEFSRIAEHPIRSGVRFEVGFPRLIPNPLREVLVTAIAMRGDSRILFFSPPAILDESKRKLIQRGLSIAYNVPCYRLYIFSLVFSSHYSSVFVEETVYRY